MFETKGIFVADLDEFSKKRGTVLTLALNALGLTVIS
jgi:hypothetical protein